MPTWEDALSSYVGIAKYLICTTCTNFLFSGSSGFWGQKLILPKVAPPGGLRDDHNHAVTFQCTNCIGKDPILTPVIAADGESVNHVHISELKDAEDKKEIERVFGDYDNRKELAAIGARK